MIIATPALSPAFLGSITTLVLVLGFTPEVWAQPTSTAAAQDAVACTMDAFMCPDGSYVGRTGPQCEFVCPSGEPGDAPATRDPLLPGEMRTSTTTLPRQKEWQENRAENQAARQALTTERQSVLSQIRQQRITNLAANISNRMDAAITRLFSIIDRLETRIVTLTQRGVDTAAAEAALQRASLSLAEAQSLMSDIDTLVYQATTSEQPAADWQPLKEHYRTVAGLIRTTHTELRAVIAALKTSVQSNSTGASDAVRNDGSIIPSPL